MTIYLKNIWPIANTDDYKIHFAQRNTEGTEPLDSWLKGAAEWQAWQEYRPENNDFNKPYIFALMRFHHEPETWLFGGVFKVLTEHANRYDVELTDIGKEFIGRLKITSSYKAMAPRTHMEPNYSKFEVKEILPKPYSGI